MKYKEILQQFLTMKMKKKKVMLVSVDWEKNCSLQTVLFTCDFLLADSGPRLLSSAYPKLSLELFLFQMNCEGFFCDVIFLVISSL